MCLAFQSSNKSPYLSTFNCSIFKRASAKMDIPVNQPSKATDTPLPGLVEISDFLG